MFNLLIYTMASSIPEVSTNIASFETESEAEIAFEIIESIPKEGTEISYKVLTFSKAIRLYYPSNY